MDLNIKKFSELTNDELYQILNLRLEVFVTEQKILYTDTDFFDQDAVHYFIMKDQAIICYLRVIAPDVIDDYFHFGRVVTKLSERKKGYASKLIKRVLADYSDQKIVISAQAYLKEYYMRFGFKVIEGPYLEEGILHYKMEINERFTT
ncbi:MAG: GNAT family N-acetyltransferase [Acholeplasmataceae bacterium]